MTRYLSPRLLVIAALMAALFASLFFAEPARFDGDLLRRSNSGEPGTLDPHLAVTAPETIIVNDLFEGLLTVDAAAKVVPGAALNYSVSEDGLTWTFGLRRGMKWSDGTSLDAADFVYSFRRAMAPETASPGAANLFAIRNGRAVNSGELPPAALGVSSPDPMTVIIELEEPTPYLDRLLLTPVAMPVPRHVIERYGKQWARPPNAVSNGAFKLDSWLPQVGIRILKNPAFHDAASVSLDGVEHIPTEDLSTQLKRFRAGEVDIGLNYPPTHTQWVRDNLGSSLRTFPIYGTYYYSLNTRLPKLSDVRVRKALDMALDRTVITKNLLFAGEQPAYSIVPPGFENYPAAQVPHFASQSMEVRRREAGELLAAAGYDASHPLELEIRYNTSEEHQNIAVAIADMWQDVGVRVTMLNTESRNHFSDLRKGSYEVGRTATFASYIDPTAFLSAFSSEDPASNLSGFADPEFDRMIEAANRIQDAQKRGAALAAAEQYALQSHALIPIYHYVSKRLISSRVTGWHDNPVGTHLSRYLGVSEQ